MGIREDISKRPWVAVSTAVVFIVAALYMSLRGGPPQHTSYKVNTYFTDDDGATFFAGEGSKLYELQGRAKPAYRATVCTCDGGKTQFVAYISRTPNELIDALRGQQATLDNMVRTVPPSDPRVQKLSDAVTAKSTAVASAIQVKRPGKDSQWLRADEAAGQAIISQIKGPPGQTGAPEVVLP
jgi:hypothetical protein